MRRLHGLVALALLTSVAAAPAAGPQPIAGPFGFENDTEGWTTVVEGAPLTTWERHAIGARSEQASFGVAEYTNGAATSLVSPVLPGGDGAVVMQWWHRQRVQYVGAFVATPPPYDQAAVEWAPVGGAWQNLDVLSGENGAWPDWNVRRAEFDPPGPFQVRFRFTSDAQCSGRFVRTEPSCIETYDGVWVDDVVFWAADDAPEMATTSVPVATPMSDGRVFHEVRDMDGETLDRADFVLGMRELEQRYPTLVRLTTVREELDDPNAVSAGDDGRPPWDPQDSGDGHDFHVATVTDRSVPDAGKGYLLLTAAHGAEWCGLEAVPRIIEDLAIAASTAPDTMVDAGTGITGEALQLPVGELLRRVKVMFVVISPDGWGYSATNGAGANTNRIAYGSGWVVPKDEVINDYGYSTLTQPAGGTITTYLRMVREQELDGRPFAAAMDYHGPLPTGSMIFVDHGGEAARIDRLHDTAERITQRAYETLWRDGGQTITPLHQQLIDMTEFPRQEVMGNLGEHRGEAEINKLAYLSAHWNSYATVWEHIDYGAPNAWAPFFGADHGLGADAFAHEVPCTSATIHRADPPELIQLFVDNIRAMTDALLVHAATRFDRDVVRTHDLGGPVGYIDTGHRVTDADGNPAPPPLGYPGTPFHPSVDQAPYDVANTDWFRDLGPAVTEAVVRLSPRRQVWPDLATIVLADHTEADLAQLRAFAEAGGNVVLTDRALALAPELLSLDADVVQEHRGYMGYVDLDRDHAWADGLHQRAKQTYDSVPLGFPLLLERDQYWINCVACPDGTGPTTFTENSAPIWSIDRSSWEAAGGTTVGTVDPPAGPKVTHEGNDTDRTVLGTAPLGNGRVVVFGAILPTPSEQHDHWFGLEPYAVTLTGQHLLLRALMWDQVVPSPRGHAALAPTGSAGGATGSLPTTGNSTMAVAIGALLLLGASFAASPWSPCTSKEEEIRNILTIFAVAMIAVAVTAPAALAGEGTSPSESGAVTRFSEPGMQALFDPVARFDLEDRSLVAFFNVDGPSMFCAGQPAGLGDLQMVETPSGHRYFLLHDELPVLVFDVTGLGSTAPEVFSQLPTAVCEGGLEPIAQGVARVRNKVHFNGSNNTFRHLWEAVGNVTDGETTWNLTTHRRAEGTLPLTGPPSVLEDTVSLVRTGRGVPAAS